MRRGKEGGEGEVTEEVKEQGDGGTYSRPPSRSLFTSSANSNTAVTAEGEQVVVETGKEAVEEDKKGEEKRRDRIVVVAVVVACAFIKDDDDAPAAAVAVFQALARARIPTQTTEPSSRVKRASVVVLNEDDMIGDAVTTIGADHAVVTAAASNSSME